MQENTLLCQVYKSKQQADMYLYVKKAASDKDALSVVPEALMNRFGTAEPSVMLMLKPNMQLARANIASVMSDIESQGFYLQMPKHESDEMRKIAEQNTKLPRS